MHYANANLRRWHLPFSRCVLGERGSLYDRGGVFLRAQSLLLQLLQLDVGVLAVELLEEVAVAGELHPGRNARGDQVLHLDGVQARALDGDDVLRGHDADVRHQGGRGHAPAVAKGRDVRQHVDVVGVARGKGVQDRLGAHAMPVWKSA